MKFEDLVNEPSLDKCTKMCEKLDIYDLIKLIEDAKENYEFLREADITTTMQHPHIAARFGCVCVHSERAFEKEANRLRENSSDHAGFVRFIREFHPDMWEEFIRLFRDDIVNGIHHNMKEVLSASHKIPKIAKEEMERAERADKDSYVKILCIAYREGTKLSHEKQGAFLADQALDVMTEIGRRYICNELNITLSYAHDEELFDKTEEDLIEMLAPHLVDASENQKEVA